MSGTMMRRRGPLYHLMWKDVQIVKSLAWAIVIGAIGLNLLVVWLSRGHSPESLMSLWLLIPNLAALGVPAMLVGTEEDSRTLGSLRTLPARWQHVADAKLIVGLLLVLGTWVLTSLILSIHGLTWRPSLVSWWNREGLQPLQFLYYLFFSGLLVLCGFVTAYSIRSPIMAIVALVPLITVVSFSSVGVGFWVVDRFGIAAVIPLGFWLLLVVAWIQRLLARRRLQAPEGSVSDWLNLGFPASVYRGPVAITFGRPSGIHALLWQQLRQILVPGVSLALIAIGVLATGVFWAQGRNVNSGPASWPMVWQPGSVLLTYLLATWLGCLAFYHDSVGRRCAFLSDRGISPTAIWWTRLLFPCLLLGVVMLGSWIRDLIMRRSMAPVAFSNVSVIHLLIAFACGQLVAQWSQRPLFSCFAAPTSAACVTVVMSLVFASDLYPEYWGLMSFVVPALLFATWRLTRRWLEGRLDWAFNGRVIGYTALALVVPCIALFGHRWVTTPAEMTGWRETMRRLEVPGPPIGQGRQVPPAWKQALVPHQGLYVQIRNLDELASKLEAELSDPNSIDGHVSLSDIELLFRHLNWFVPRSTAIEGLASEMEANAIEVLLRWAQLLRTQGARGEIPLRYVLAADNLERVAGAQLKSNSLAADSDTHGRLAAMIPDPELRRESRRVALIREWQWFNSEPWPRFTAPNPNKDFAELNLIRRLGPRIWLSIEQVRTERYLDQFVQGLLQRLDSISLELPWMQTLEEERAFREAFRSQPENPFRLWKAQYVPAINNQAIKVSSYAGTFMDASVVDHSPKPRRPESLVNITAEAAVSRLTLHTK